MRDSLQTVMKPPLHCDEEPYNIEFCVNWVLETVNSPQHIPYLIDCKRHEMVLKN